MQSPAVSDRGTNWSLYGGQTASINRRSMIAGVVAAGLWPGPVLSRATPDADPLAKAMAAMGGKSRLRRVRSVQWSGTAVVRFADRTIDLTLLTTWRPFAGARSQSWITSQGRERAATLVVDPARAYSERNGVRKDLPEAQAVHERQQFGLYGYMLLAQAPILAEGSQLRSVRPGYPPIVLDLDDEGRLVGARYVVASPEGNRMIVERVIFGGEIASNGVRWPRHLTIDQDGKPYFELDLTSFVVTLA